MAAGSTLALSTLTGCASLAPTPDSPVLGEDELAGYDKFRHSSGDIQHDVFVSRGSKGPGVIIMHELTGLHQPTKDFADWLVERGYRVYLPLLFGPAMTRQPVRNVVRICIRNEIYLFARGRSSPITDWLRSLAQVARSENGGTPIGVVGMCLTGGFVIPLIVDDAVVAGVAAQPSLPIFASNRLGVDQATIQQVTQATNDEVLSLRFEGDSISPLSRHQRIAEVMCGSESRVVEPAGEGDKNRYCEEYELLEVPGDGHSTLTGDYPRALSRGVDTRAKVLSLFERKLKPQWLLAMSKADEAR